jgi:hypothetical protein
MEDLDQIQQLMGEAIKQMGLVVRMFHKHLLFLCSMVIQIMKMMIGNKGIKINISNQEKLTKSMRNCKFRKDHSMISR